jgi:U3 small nucleolar RNA-associated protein 12
MRFAESGLTWITGFMTGSTDKLVKFWDFGVSGGSITAQLTRQLQMTSEILCLRYSPTKQQDKVCLDCAVWTFLPDNRYVNFLQLLLAVGLLDCTVKVFFDDSLKFMLSLFGHKLPVLCLDISYDGTLLVSGSADKTVKIWGLDFGDCHRSLIAHEDSVTAVRFQPQTHYFFTAGKDGIVKYWDADR